MTVSVVVPICNERDNLRPLTEQLHAALAESGEDYEIILADDGSRDGSSELLDELAAADPLLRVIHLRRNFGQSAALDAGFQWAEGDVVVTLDGDLQNDPADIPRLVAKLREGYDLVHGWRKERQDRFWDRRLPSRIANVLIARTTGHGVHDLGCALKAMKAEIAKELHLQGEMHRFIAVLAVARGARVCEVETHHRARLHGTTKYGLSRTFRVILDWLTVLFLIRFTAAPMRCFGSAGLACGLLGGTATLGAGLLAWAGHGREAAVAGIAGLIGGGLCLQLLAVGLTAEIMVRAWYHSRGLRPYAIRNLVNFDRSAEAVPPLRLSA